MRRNPAHHDVIVMSSCKFTNMHRSTRSIVAVAKGLFTNKHKGITNHDTDMTVIIVWNKSYHAIQRVLKPLNKQNSRITVMSHECHCLFKSLFRPTTKRSALLLSSTHKGPIIRKPLPCHHIVWEVSNPL